MSEAAAAPPDASESARPDAGRLILFAAAGVAALALIVALVALFVALGMRDDIALQARKSYKAIKELREQNEELQDTVARLKAPTARTERKDANASSRAPVLMHIDSANPATDCVIRPGSGKGLSDCIGAR